MGMRTCLVQRLTRIGSVRTWRFLKRFAGSLQVVDWPELEKVGLDGDSTFSEIVDVRSPGEFSIDHIPGAINLPVLQNDERVTVGIEYNASQFSARRTGASIVCQNLAHHLGPNGHLAKKESDYRPLIYCWRGGMRSKAVAEVLQQVGFDVGVLSGGYRSYRTWVRDQLSSLPKSHKFVIISGLTGSGKSRLLELLSDRGEQIIHLERLAHHKGSLLGLYPGVDKQPSQRSFDSQLVPVLRNLAQDRPVWLECESRSVGNIHLPDSLWSLMSEAPRVFIEAAQNVRRDFIIKDYDYLVTDPECLRTRLGWISTFHSEQVLQRWLSLVESGNFEGLVTDLLQNHYDPLYKRSRARFIQCTDPSKLRRISVRSLLDEEYLKNEIVPDIIKTGYEMI